MLQVKRAGHSTLTTPDIGRMADYFTRIVELSLVARDKDRAILATKSGLEANAATPARHRACLFKSRPAATLTRSRYS
jgi:hypothetical protein